MIVSLQDDPAEYLASLKFHRSCRIGDGRRVTYADCGSADEKAPVILFLYGLSGHRLHSAYHDAMLESKGVRLIMVDRPGIGGSDAVPLQYRIEALVESVLHLIDVNNLKSFTLMSQSSGLIYLLSVYLALPTSVICSRMYLISPFVPEGEADSKAIRMLSLLPNFAISQFHHLIPVLSSSFGLISRAKTKAWSMIPFIDNGTGDLLADWFTQECKKASHERTYWGRYLTADAQALIDQYVSLEDLTGISDEAAICLEKDLLKPCLPGFPGFDHVFRKLDENLRASTDTSHLHISIYWGSDDGLIGPGGKQYLEKVITDVATAGSGKMIFEREDIPGGHHGDLLNRDCVLGKIAGELSANS